MPLPAHLSTHPLSATSRMERQDWVRARQPTLSSPSLPHSLFSPTRHYQNKLSTRILQPPGQDWTRHLIQYQAFEALCTPDPGCSTAILHPSSQHTNATGVLLYEGDFRLACAGSSEVELFSGIREVKCLVIDVVAAFPAYGCKLGVPFGHWAPTTCGE